jgi:hypothetical protein
MVTARQLGQDGINIECSGGVCRGKTDAGVAMIVALQQALNRFTGSVGLQPIAIDGVIGGDTVNLAIAVGLFVKNQASSALLSALIGPFQTSNQRTADRLATASSPVDVANTLPTSFQFVEQAGDALSMPADVPAPSAGGGGGASSSSAPAPGTPGAVTAPSKSNAIWWVVGTGALLTAVGIGITMLGKGTARRRRAAAY